MNPLNTLERRGMTAISTDAGSMLIVAADQRNSMKAVMDGAPDGPSSIPAAELAAARDVEDWEWKHYSHDQPADLPQRLSRAGLVPGPAETLMVAEVDAAKKDADTLGGIVEVLAFAVPPGLGSHVQWDRKLDARLAAALMSIQSVKGVEIGDGFAAATLSGEQNADAMRPGAGGPDFLANHAGGILGGISTGQPVVARFAVKPTSSILTPRQSVDRTGKEVDVMTKGRHDPCVGIRAVPIGEAMVACAIADHYLRHRGQTGRI